MGESRGGGGRAERGRIAERVGELSGVGEMGWRRECCVGELGGDGRAGRECWGGGVVGKEGEKEQLS